VNTPNVRLENVCSFLAGFAWSANEFATERHGLPIIRIQNVDAVRDSEFVYWNSTFDDRYIIERGDILLTLSGSFRAVVWSGPKALLNQRIVKLTPKAEITAEWLLYVIRHKLLEISSMGRHALVSNVALSDLRGLTVPLPPITEQRRIAAILDQADALRTQRRQALAELDRLAQAVFVEMFGDPASNPMRWPTAILSTLAADGDGINYGVVQPGDPVEEGVPLIRVGDLVDGTLTAGFLKRIDPTIEAAYARSRLRGDEILVSCVGSIGVTVLATPAMKGFNIARAVARIPLGASANRIFIASYLMTNHVQRYFTSELRTVAQPTLNIKQLASTVVLCPPLALQEKFAGRVQTIESLKSTHRAALAESDALFASLQHRAFSGEL
jgi:type I restriction enzyme S subunit